MSRCFFAAIVVLAVAPVRRVAETVRPPSDDLCGSRASAFAKGPWRRWST